MGETVDIAELRENLVDYLRRAEAGEHFVVMDGDEPVAELAAPAGARFDRMIEEGKAIPLGSLIDDLSEPLPEDPDDPYSLSRALEEVRGYRPMRPSTRTPPHS